MALRYLTQMKNEGMIYVSDWDCTGIGRKSRIFKIGNLPDAPCPLSQREQLREQHRTNGTSRGPRGPTGSAPAEWEWY